MARAQTAAKLHLLTARQVLRATDGDHADGGGLLLRVRSARTSAAGKPLPPADCWVFRYTSPSGQRREMGLGLNRRGSLAQAGDSLTSARDAAHKARELLRQGIDPLQARDAQREASREAE